MKRHASRVAQLTALASCAVAFGPVHAATDATSGVADDARLSISLEVPEPGGIVRNRVHLAPVRGSAQSGATGLRLYDVMIAIDVSYSTRLPSGIDVDEDGEIGLNPNEELMAPGTFDPTVVCTDPDDTILAAEVHATRLLLDALESDTTRIGIVTFSGESDPETGLRLEPDQQDAWVIVPLTRDYDLVRESLEQILGDGPHGATNFAAAIRSSVAELAGLPGARSEPALAEGELGSVKRVLLFLTDGEPSFPFGRAAVSDPEDTEAAVRAARLAKNAGVSIHSYALGRRALSRPVAVNEMARLTAGSFTPVRNPGEIVAFLQGVSFANVDDVVITNLTLREVSTDVSLAPDGSFSGFVPVRPGPNKVQVTALASDGQEVSEEIDFAFEETELTEAELARELERIKRRNKQLMLLLERERIQKFRDRQRKVVVESDE